MEVLREYWWVVLGAIVLLFFVSRGSGGGATVSQIGGASGNDLAIAQLNAQSQAQNRSDRFGLIKNLLEFDLANRGLESSERLGVLQIDASRDIAASTAAANAQAANYAYQLQQAQLQAQVRAYNQANSQQTTSNWLSLLGSGLGTFLPIFTGGSQNGGGGGVYYPTQPTFPTGGGSQGGWGTLGSAIGGLLGRIFS